MNDTPPQATAPTVLDWLLDYWWLLLIVAVVLLLVLVYVLVIRSRRTEAAEEAEEQTAKKDPEIDGLKQSFEEGLKRLKAYVPGDTYRLQLPWYLMIGEEGLGKTTLLENIDLPLPMGAPAEAYEHTVSWWFFQDAVVLDVPGDYLLARDPDATRNLLWEPFLRLLQRHRRPRPIDGIILVLPGPDLFGPEALTPAVIDYKAELLYEKLLEAQRVLGLRVPIYVLFSRCDCIPSFQGYIHELPLHHRDTIFGWSNPYALDTAYTSDWVDEAFDGLAEVLYRSQIELVANGIDSDKPDGFFLFPTEFQELRHSINHYLERIFRPSAYHDAFYLRGIYFTGDGAGELGLPPALVSPEANGGAASDREFAPPASETPDLVYRPHPVFLKELFGKKIFPEFELAGPISQIFRWRNRTARTLRWAGLLLFLIWGLGLLFAYNRLDREINGDDEGGVGVLGVLEDIDKNVVAVRAFAQRDDDEPVNREAEEQLYSETRRLFEQFAALHAARVGSVFIPASWFSSIDRDIENAFSIAYDRVVLKLVHLELGHEVDRLIEANYTVPASPRLSLMTLEEQPRFREMRQYVDAMTTLEEQAQRYNSLETTRSLEHLAGVFEYLFRRQAYQVPPGFLDESDLYRSALGSIEIDSFRFEPHRFKADSVATRMAARLYVDLFADNALYKRLRQLRQHLETIRTFDRQELSASREADTLFQTLRLIQDVELWLDDPRLVYLQYKTGPGADTLSLTQLVGPAFEEMIGRMERSAFFSRVATDPESYQQLSWSALNRAQEDMLVLDIPPTSQRMLVPGQDRALEPSPDLLEVKNAAVRLLEKHAADPRTPRRIPVDLRIGYRLRWDLDLLREAAELPDQYEDLTASAEKSLVMVLMTDHVARAATFAFDSTASDPNVSEAELLPQIENFRAASVFLNSVLNRFQELQARNQREALLALTTAHAYDLLNQVDHLLDVPNQLGVPRRPYYVLSLSNAASRWQHGTPLYTAVFDTDDETVVDAYLTTQREWMQYLHSEFAAPPVSFLAGVRTVQYPSDLQSKWTKMGQALQEYEQKQPGNSLGVLESFVSQVMLTTTPDSCLTVLDAADPRGQDYFIDRLIQLRNGLQRICEPILLDEAITEYEALGTTFNDRFAEHFPFDLQDTGAEVDPETLRRFFADYDRFAETYVPYIEGNADDFDPRLQAFFQDMTVVRDFFAPFLDETQEGDLPQFDFEIDFRVDREQENSGKNIIDWQLFVDDRMISIHDTLRVGRWTYGEPIRFVLRWAKDGPVKPIDRQGANVQTDVDARRVTYTYANAWALLSFLGRHRLEPDDPDPVTLKFSIPVEDAGTLAAPDPSVVYVRMVLKPPGSNTPLVVPSFFPRRAPASATGNAN